MELTHDTPMPIWAVCVGAAGDVRGERSVRFDISRVALVNLSLTIGLWWPWVAGHG
jgi:hypothetical protein